MQSDISFYYTLPYLAMASFYFILFLLELKIKSALIKKSICLACPIIFFLFWGFRGFVATDWKHYCPMFENKLFDSVFMEPGFILLTTLIRFFTDNYFCYQMVLTGFSIIILQYLFIKYSPFQCLSWFIWLSCFLIYHDLLRFFIAILIVYSSFQYIFQKNMLRYFLMVVIASTFHISVILFLPLYFLIDRKYSEKIYWIILLLCLLAFISDFSGLELFLRYLHIFTPKSDFYVTGFFANSKMNMSFLGILPLTAFYIYGVLYYQKLSLNKYGNLFFNLYVVFFIIVCFLNDNGEVQRRLSYLFRMSWCFLLPIYLQLPLKLPKKIITFLIVIYGFRQCNSYNNIMWKYENTLFTNITQYEERKVEISIISKSLGTAGNN